jgi:nickel/cobalt exporter
MLSSCRWRRCRGLAIAAASCCGLAIACHGVAHAGPFGLSAGPPPAPSFGGFGGWMLAKQAEFYHLLAGAIRQTKAEGNATASLLGISFVYGIFHAAGPGHGKAVISSYLFANDETWRRGVALSFAAALIQSLTAILIVAVAAILLGGTAKMMGDTVRVIEIASYAAITLIGARLLWVKGRGFVAALYRFRQPERAAANAQGSHRDAGCSHDHHAHLDHRHDHHHHAGAACACCAAEPGGHEEHASAWGHAHGPEPEELAGPGGWSRGLSAIVAVGLRPCSGAIIVLVFALSQGLFWSGVGATFVMGVGTAVTVAAIATLAVVARSAAARVSQGRSGAGMLVLRGMEAGAAILVMLFGVALLTGYMASERLFGF